MTGRPDAEEELYRAVRGVLEDEGLCVSDAADLALDELLETQRKYPPRQDLHPRTAIGSASRRIPCASQRPWQVDLAPSSAKRWEVRS